MRFEGDSAKNASNVAKHKIPLMLGAAVFAGPFIEWEDLRRDYAEERFVAVGPVPGLDDTLYLVVYTWR